MNKELIWSASKKDFKIDWFSGTGSGGQHRNKHQNCCRITHIESGIVAVGQDHKDRPTNQKAAFNQLAKKLIEYYELDKPKVHAETSNETVRTYHEPRNIVKDHSSEFQQEYKYVVDNANVGDMLESRKKALMND